MRRMYVQRKELIKDTLFSAKVKRKIDCLEKMSYSVARVNLESRVNHESSQFFVLIGKKI